MKSPINWLAMCVILMAGILLLSTIPVASLLLQIIMPGFSAGLMLAAHALHRGERINIGYLIEGFKRNSNELLALGAISFVANAIIMVFAAALMSVFIGASFIETIKTLESGVVPSEEMLSGLMLMLLIMFTLTLPLIMALWFAPSLIILNNLKAWDAFKTSFNACNRNIIPFLVYGLIGIPLIIMAAIPYGAGFIVLIPVFFCSIYCTWRDVFGESKTQAPVSSP